VLFRSVSVQEPSSCTYTLTIATPRLCKHPAFQQQPPPAALIQCHALPEEGGGVEAGAGSCAVADSGAEHGSCATDASVPAAADVGGGAASPAAGTAQPAAAPEEAAEAADEEGEYADAEEEAEDEDEYAGGGEAPAGAGADDGDGGPGASRFGLGERQRPVILEQDDRALRGLERERACLDIVSDRFFSCRIGN